MKTVIDDRQSSRDLDFKNRLVAEGKCSYWFALVTSFMVVPFVSYTIINSIMLFKGPPFKVRCEIPALENLPWSFEEIQRLIQPNDSYKICVYYNYDYEKLAGLSYNNALKIPKTSTQELSCSSLVFNDDSGYTTIYKDFTLFCHKTIETLIILSNVIGNMFGNILFVPIADIYSRKAMLSFSLRMSQVAAVGMIFFDNMELFMFVSMLYGIAYAITNVTLHALALELCSPLLRPCRFFILHALSDGISYVLIPLVASFCVHWRYLLCFYSIGILFLPLVDWFVPASPLWFYTKSRKVAWTLLESSKTPHVNNEVLSFYRNNKINLTGELFWHLNEFKRTKHTFFWCYLMLVGISSSICSSNFIDYFQDIFNSQYFLYFFAISRLISMTSSVFLIALIGRKTTVYTSQTLLFILCIIITQCNRDSGLAFGVFYLIDACTNLLYGVCKLHAIENAPTTYRSTFLGSYEFAGCVFRICLFFVLRSVAFNVYFILVAVLACFSFALSWYTDQDNVQELFNCS